MITMHDAERTDPSYRLYNSRSLESAQLIQPDGTLVQQWSYEQGLSWHYAEMLPNGNLVAIAKDHMILELDPQSRLVWKHDGNAHHDFARKDDGNTYVVSGRPGFLAPSVDADRPLYMDLVEEVTRAGSIPWRWLPEEHVDELADLVELILPPSHFGDWPHLNTVEILPDGPTASKDHRFRRGNLLLCGRHIDTVFVVDRNTGSVVWAWGPGELLGPHMPTMLANGHLIIYDNGHNVSRSVRGYTRILEMDPLSGEIVWSYQSPSNFFSPSRGSAELLPNGNCLIAHSDSGRLFEVTRKGEVVWEFLNDTFGPRGCRDPLYRTRHYPVEAVPEEIARPSP